MPKVANRGSGCSVYHGAWRVVDDTILLGRMVFHENPRKYMCHAEANADDKHGVYL